MRTVCKYQRCYRMHSGEPMPTTAQARRTALHSMHCELNARIVNFAGWEMPLQYSTGIMAEHKHCRSTL